MIHKHLPDYLSVGEDLGWILLRTVQGACLGVVLLVAGMAFVGVADLVLEAGTLRPATLFAATQESRPDVAAAVARLGTVGLGAVMGFATAFAMEQLLMIKAYLRALAAGKDRLPER